MEARLSSSDDAHVATLMRHYEKLKARFAADLANPRDRALALSAALMLVQSIAEID